MVHVKPFFALILVAASIIHVIAQPLPVNSKNTGTGKQVGSPSPSPRKASHKPPASKSSTRTLKGRDPAKKGSGKARLPLPKGAERLDNGDYHCLYEHPTTKIPCTFTNSHKMVKDHIARHRDWALIYPPKEPSGDPPGHPQENLNPPGHPHRDVHWHDFQRPRDGGPIHLFDPYEHNHPHPVQRSPSPESIDNPHPHDVQSSHGGHTSMEPIRPFQLYEHNVQSSYSQESSHPYHEQWQNDNIYQHWRR